MIHPSRDKYAISISHDDEHKKVKSPQEFGEESVSGSMPDPESDDDMLENAWKMGLYTKDDEEHPQELNIAKEIEKAEKYKLTH